MNTMASTSSSKLLRAAMSIHMASREADAIRYAVDHPVKNFLGKAAEVVIFDVLLGDLDGGTVYAADFTEQALTKIADTDNAKRILSSITKSYTVYTLRDAKTGAIKYVGITSNEIARKNAHSVGDKKGLKFIPEMSDLSYKEGRAAEQILFEQHGGFKKLLNKINPISPKKFVKYLDSAWDVIKKIK